MITRCYFLAVLILSSLISAAACAQTSTGRTEFARQQRDDSNFALRAPWFCVEMCDALSSSAPAGPPAGNGDTSDSGGPNPVLPSPDTETPTEPAARSNPMALDQIAYLELCDAATRNAGHRMQQEQDEFGMSLGPVCFSVAALRLAGRDPGRTQP